MAEFIHVSLDMFFEDYKILAAMDRKNELVLSRTGAYGQKVMQRGMRYRKKASAPNKFPSAHKPLALLREMILFGSNDPTNDVVVGPRLLDRTDREVAAIGKTVPQLVNEGGVVTRRRIWDAKKKKMRFTNRPIRWRYQPRPFVTLSLPPTAEFFAKQTEDVEFK